MAAQAIRATPHLKKSLNVLLEKGLNRTGVLFSLVGKLVLVQELFTIHLEMSHSQQDLDCSLLFSE